MSDTAIATIVTGVVTIVTLIISVITLWIKQNTTGKKVDENTRITKVGAEATVIAAARLNGELDTRIKNVVMAAVDLLRDELRVHATQDEKNMVDIRNALNELIKR